MGIIQKLPLATLALQGVMVTTSGLFMLFRPENFLLRAGEVGTLVFGSRPELVRASSLQLLTMGSYFLLTSTCPAIYRRALILNTILRGLATAVFWKFEMESMIWYEILFVVINGTAALCV